MIAYQPPFGRALAGEGEEQKRYGYISPTAVVGQAFAPSERSEVASYFYESGKGNQGRNEIGYRSDYGFQVDAERLYGDGVSVARSYEDEVQTIREGSYDRQTEATLGGNERASGEGQRFGLVPSPAALLQPSVRPTMEQMNRYRGYNPSLVEADGLMDEEEEVYDGRYEIVFNERPDYEYPQESDSGRPRLDLYHQTYLTSNQIPPSDPSVTPYEQMHGGKTAELCDFAIAPSFLTSMQPSQLEGSMYLADLSASCSPVSPAVANPPFRGFSTDETTRSPLVMDVNPSLPICPASNAGSDQSHGGITLSAWLAETVWNMVINPFEPGRLGVADGNGRKVTHNPRNWGSTQPKIKPDLPWSPYNYNLRPVDSSDDLLNSSYGWQFGQISHHHRAGYYPDSAIIHISPPLTPSPTLYHNPYGLPLKPSPSFLNYVHRTLSQTLLSPTAVVLSLWYIRRFAIHTGGGEEGKRLRQSLANASLDPEGRGAEESVRRILFLGLASSNKWLDDNTFTNKSWSDVTRLPLSELNHIEILALGPLSFDLSISQDEWTLWLKEVEQQITPFVTDSRLISDAICNMRQTLNSAKHRFHLDVVLPLSRATACSQSRYTSHQHSVSPFLSYRTQSMLPSLLPPMGHPFPYAAPMYSTESTSTQWPEDFAQKHLSTNTRLPPADPASQYFEGRGLQNYHIVANNNPTPVTLPSMTNGWGSPSIQHHTYRQSSSTNRFAPFLEQAHNSFALPPLRTLAAMA